MGSIIMNGCRIGRGSIIGAGSILLENQEIPPFSLVVGSPGQVKKTYDEKIRISSSVYVARAAKFLQDLERI
jgi:carbonic anhydrase/acetyltransferase-like protein (isoleucine patch superfamily)